jgi:hypothetical protein
MDFPPADELNGHLPTENRGDATGTSKRKRAFAGQSEAIVETRLFWGTDYNRRQGCREADAGIRKAKPPGLARGFAVPVGETLASHLPAISGVTSVVAATAVVVMTSVRPVAVE